MNRNLFGLMNPTFENMDGIYRSSYNESAKIYEKRQMLNVISMTKFS